MDDRFIVTIRNWEKYNNRNDVKKASWFRLEHSFFDSSRFYGLTASQKLLWIYLLCEVSKHSAESPGTTIIATMHATAILGLSVKELHQAIEIFKEFQMLTTRTLRGRYADVTQTCSTNDTNDTNERYDTDERDQNLPGGSAEKPPKAPPVPSKGSLVWEAYREAYWKRYGIDPVRNAQVNAQCSQLAKRLGAEAPQVAAAYLSHSDAFYVRCLHPIGLLVKDAEKLRTEWKLGSRMTGQLARQVEMRAANDDVVNAVVRKLEAEDAEKRNQL